MNHINEKRITAYLSHLTAEERSPATVEKYARGVRAFAAWLGGAAATQDAAAKYKRRLSHTHKASSVNASVAALNAFFAFFKWGIKLKPLKTQRQTFRPKEMELTRVEYERLLSSAQDIGDERLNLVLQTICSAGIRVSELYMITVEAICSGVAVITNKGKTRTVFLPEKLQAALLRYTGARGIDSGSVFVTRSGKPIDRRQVWADMKKLCEAANVEASKVFPHNLRHLFARSFYSRYRDIVRLADVLGHSNVNTTRVYTMESGAELRRLIDDLELAKD